MHILISNDDGYMAPGINALANEMRRFGRVSIVAPEHNRKRFIERERIARA